ncbi:MAG: galactokinase [Henriciella sp.]|nr:galactokinase [Henriciella sp.]
MSQGSSFEQAFGRPADASGSAPGRVNLIGEHTDYNGGAVLPAALERRTEVWLARSEPPVISIVSTRFEHKIERPVGDPKRGDWTDYAMGALAKASELGWLTGGACLYIDSDVPDGAGVSSSAALITAILRAVATIADVDVTPVDIAKHARAVENDYIGMPCGIMDQMAVGLADQGKALALDTSDLSYDIIDIPTDWRFVVLHSGIRRELADGRYKARFEECSAAAAALGTETLCRLTPAQIAAVATLPENLRKRTTHVVSEHQRTVAASAAMRAGDLATFAQLMNESHRSYSEDFEASTPEIDALIKDALEVGALGARLTGGGFGGCLVALIAAQDSAAFVDTFLARHEAVWRV